MIIIMKRLSWCPEQWGENYRVDSIDKLDPDTARKVALLDAVDSRRETNSTAVKAYLPGVGLRQHYDPSMIGDKGMRYYLGFAYE